MADSFSEQTLQQLSLRAEGRLGSSANGAPEPSSPPARRAAAAPGARTPSDFRLKAAYLGSPEGTEDEGGGRGGGRGGGWGAAAAMRREDSLGSADASPSGKEVLKKGLGGGGVDDRNGSESPQGPMLKGEWGRASPPAKVSGWAGMDLVIVCSE